MILYVISMIFNILHSGAGLHTIIVSTDKRGSFFFWGQGLLFHSVLGSHIGSTVLLFILVERREKRLGGLIQSKNLGVVGFETFSVGFFFNNKCKKVLVFRVKNFVRNFHTISHVTMMDDGFRITEEECCPLFFFLVSSCLLLFLFLNFPYFFIMLLLHLVFSLLLLLILYFFK